jgi:cyanophycinase-like exopeptidase
LVELHAENATPGPIALFGSGETAPSGRKAFEWLLRKLPLAARIAILETPAGFEPNSERVAGKIAEFLLQRLQNFDPQPELIAARQRGAPLSPDAPAVVAPLAAADLIFLGPGSPTYTVRQLRDSLAWALLQAAHRQGAALGLASAAAIAMSAYALPVYEIYKVGADLHWQPGLNLLAPFGLNLVIVPHWDNRDGGDELDTSRCFMGRARFAALIELLPPDVTLLGIAENTSLVLDLAAGYGEVVGAGEVTVLHTGHEHADLPEQAADLAALAAQRENHVHQWPAGERLALTELGPFRLPAAGEGLSPTALAEVAAAHATRTAAAAPVAIPDAVAALAEARQNARQDRDWAAADRLRADIEAQGWLIQDTAAGYALIPRP